MPKPLPIPDELTKPFWDAVNKQQLVIQRCQDCKRFHHPPVGLCPDCYSANLEFESVSGRGKVSSYSITHDARTPAFSEIQPYPVAIVELEEQRGIFLFTNLPGAPHDQIKSGQPVEVEFEEIAPGRFIPQFHLVR